MEYVDSIKDIFEERKESQDALCKRCLPNEISIKMTGRNTKGLHRHANSIHNIWQRQSATQKPTGQGMLLLFAQITFHSKFTSVYIN
jgi:hypothetical protein